MFSCNVFGRLSRHHAIRTRIGARVPLTVFPTAGYRPTRSPGCLPGRSRSTACIVRRMPDSFTEAIREKPAAIDVLVARDQHATYTEHLRSNSSVSTVVEVPADERHPDCIFVEDNAIVVGDKALITRSGAPSRRGEVVPVQEALHRLGVSTVRMEAPGTLDGGDVIVVPGHIFVGDSERSNEQGAAALAVAFPSHRVSRIKVAGALHLKSMLSWAGPEVGFIVGDNPPSRAALQTILDTASETSGAWDAHVVPDAVAANVLRVGQTVYYHDNMAASRPHFLRLAEQVRDDGVQFVGINLSELNKADAALTCCSLLIDIDE